MAAAPVERIAGSARLRVPAFCLVVLIGPAGSGKSTFASRCFRPTEVLSTDALRAMVGDDPANQAASKDAFELLHDIVGRRLAARRLTVVDATNVRAAARKELLQIARAHYAEAIAIAFDLALTLCLERDAARPERSVGEEVVRQQHHAMRASLERLPTEGFARVYHLADAQAASDAALERAPLACDRTHDRGPFDVVGDVHGCCDELEELLDRLGYAGQPDGAWRHPDGRRVIFVGDLGDRGPRILDSFRLAMRMCRDGAALCLPGNHDVKLLRLLRGANVKVAHGLAQTLAELEALPPAKRAALEAELRAFLEALPSHLYLDRGRLVVAHAGLPRAMHGRECPRIRRFALFGDATGRYDAHGLPIRRDWAAAYRGRARVVYGHTPVAGAAWRNNTINIDTGCVFGGALTALRYPELELIAVPARRTYAEPRRPLLDPQKGQHAG